MAAITSLETVVGTNGNPRATGRLTSRATRALRRARHHPHRRRGHGRLRRCGEWFAVDHWVVRPDLITFAKGVNSGYVPLGGVIISDEIRRPSTQRAFPGGLTYSGHPLACASAVASINAFREEGIIENARMLAPTSSVPGCRRSRRSTRASATCAVSGSSGRSSWFVTVRRASRWCPTTRGSVGGADDGLRGGVQGARAVALHPFQPNPRRAALHHHARGSRGTPPSRCSTMRSPWLTPSRSDSNRSYAVPPYAVCGRMPVGGRNAVHGRMPRAAFPWGRLA